jgi:hypothetical protein
MLHSPASCTTAVQPRKFDTEACAGTSTDIDSGDTGPGTFAGIGAVNTCVVLVLAPSPAQVLFLTMVLVLALTS